MIYSSSATTIGDITSGVGTAAITSGTGTGAIISSFTAGATPS